ncbi:glycosyltransferase family 39 protein [Actinoplanes sp. NBRC 101535]|uniref:ArnT family glycosyltransferase n=1 Tax=Actinoplanes sp. NBRC 101535 TaxID=3032196 RepID=UPI0024A3C0D4|nr:glycosyltransferase family 39 protein [Actinoplanes sp. NBRC 101535]GLY02208.1 glycosyl transferase [Actinoplanes sp. NBRC 101535]
MNPSRPSIRIAFWRSPEGQPDWARPALLTLAAITAVLYGWRIEDSGFASYYALAVKSMSVNGWALLYGALDPGATITLDKLAGAFVPQAISARLFGFHEWSLALPQVVEGVVAVLVMYRIGRRLAGPAAGLLAAGLFGLTPVVASMFGHAMEDGLLTLCLVLAADAFLAALTSGRLGPLLLAGVWVGLGFQAKMMQAWLILPAMAVTFLVAAPGGWRRRLGRLTAAGAVTLAVSLSWIALYEATPAGSRPYVDGSTNDSAIAMVFGYNGFDRFGWHVPGAVRVTDAGAGDGGGVHEESPHGSQGGQGGGFEQQETPDQGGPAKLAGARYASQIGWLYPLALFGLLFGLIARGRAPRTDPLRAGLLFGGSWLLVVAAVLGGMTIAHQAYLASLAPPLAVLSALAVVRAWTGLRDGDAPWQLPVLVVAELLWTIHLSRRFPDFLPWLWWVVAAAGAIALLVLAVARTLRRVRVAAMALAVAAMVATPVFWAASVLDPRYGGDAFEASAGPRPGGRAGTAGGNDLSPTGVLTAEQSRLHAYLTAHRDGARFLAATTFWHMASPYIAATGQAYLPMGGNHGSVPQPTPAGVEALVGTGELRYFLLPAAGDPGRRDGDTGTIGAIAAWVTATCRVVTDVAPPRDQVLYRCR